MKILWEMGFSLHSRISMLSPRWVGDRAAHGVLTVRSVPRVGILIVQDIPRAGNLTTILDNEKLSKQRMMEVL